MKADGQVEELRCSRAHDAKFAVARIGTVGFSSASIQMQADSAHNRGCTLVSGALHCKDIGNKLLSFDGLLPWDRPGSPYMRAVSNCSVVESKVSSWLSGNLIYPIVF